jgi:transposase
MTELSNSIMELRAQGLSYREISKTLGCSKGTISYHVAEGQKEKNQARARSRRSLIEKYITDYKQERGCQDCKEMYPHYMLEFDHLHSKEFGISQYKKRTISLEKVKQEIDKCEVVCANCHRIRTHVRASGGSVIY